MEVYDCIVVGGGVIGTSAAYHCAKNGKKVIMLEQFGLPHTRGSSHGQSRVARMMGRRALGKDAYPGMMKEAFEQWKSIENQTGISLYIQTGILNIGEGDSESLEPYVENMEKHGFPYKLFTPGELRKNYSGLCRYPEEYHGMLEEDAGVLRADVCLRALRILVGRYGGQIQDGVKVEQVIGGTNVRVITKDGRTYHGKSVILTPGPWAGGMLSSLGINIPFKTVRVSQPYFRVRKPGLFDKAPMLVHWQGDPHSGRFYYILPSLEYPDMIKIGTRSNFDPNTDPEERDRNPEVAQSSIDHIRKYIRNYLQNVDDEPCVVESGVTTYTPDRAHILDHHPQFRNIVMACGFSGYGFKLAPTIGKLLYEMASGLEPSHDFSAYKLSRFLSRKSKL